MGQEITIISASNPRCYQSDGEAITLDVRFSHIPSPIPFTAKRDDVELHGRELYSRAVFGEFGEFGEFGDITVLTPPTSSEDDQRVRLDEALKQAAAAMAPLEDADELGVIRESEKIQLIALRHYRVALFRLPESEGWPTAITWPEMPQ
ncbi:tail fiber assembly protein [Aeromonas media]|uniref:tail fiber assembly protein n=1 Tax=Aeromonas media TaxID=651 RepID=UPI0029D4F61A|nr:tail fiber assembly protein [Aeromonas media]MDX7900153.1 tail fiber assembly protein [Aeromonas media]